MSNITISVRNLSKKYRLYDSPKHRMKEALHPFRKKFHRDFWALKDVSFEVKKGECLGIIGRNGSGKSTLLQILCGVLQPTGGEVMVNGKVSALLELGTGFNPEFTGRQNVYMNGALMGFNKDEMDERFQAVADFAEIGEFIDQPVKTYSSGMYVRLAFASAINADPDILVVDEALSVGDFFFQQKCLKRLRELQDRGITLLFVSHDMSTVRDLCQTAIYLNGGRQIFMGESRTAIGLFFQRSSDNLMQKASFEGNQGRGVTNERTDEFLKNCFWVNKAADIAEGRAAKVFAVAVLDKNGLPTMKAKIGEEIIIRVLYRVFAETPVHVSIVLRNKYDQIINSSGSYTLGIEPLKIAIGKSAVFELRMLSMIEAGLYTFSAKLGILHGGPNRGVDVDETGWLGPLKIEWDYENVTAPFLGMFGIPAGGEFFPLEEIG